MKKFEPFGKGRKVAFFELQGWETSIIKKGLEGKGVEVILCETEILEPSSKKLSEIKDVEILSIFVSSVVNKEVIDALPKLKLNERIEFSGREVSLPSQLEDIKLYKDNNGFHIIKDDKIYNVKNCLCDSLLQRMTREQLEVFLGRKKLTQIDPKDLINSDGKEAVLNKLLSGGYISVSQMSDGEYVLYANGKFWNRENKKAVIILLTAAAAASAYIAAVYYFLGDDPLLKKTIRDTFTISGHILASAGVGLVGGGILGTGAGIINKKKGVECLGETLLGATYGYLLGVGIGLGYGWHEFLSNLDK